MQTRNSSKSGIFLMELILSILFFSIAAAVCVKLFVTSHNLSDRSVKLNEAVTMAENIAEAFYGSNGDEEVFRVLLPEMKSCTEPGGRTELLLESPDQEIGAVVILDSSAELKVCEIRIGTLEQVEDTIWNGSGFDPLYELHLSLFPQEENTDETK